MSEWTIFWKSKNSCRRFSGSFSTAAASRTGPLRRFHNGTHWRTEGRCGKFFDQYTRWIPHGGVEGIDERLQGHVEGPVCVDGLYVGSELIVLHIRIDADATERLPDEVGKARIEERIVREPERDPRSIRASGQASLVKKLVGEFKVELSGLDLWIVERFQARR